MSLQLTKELQRIRHPVASRPIHNGESLVNVKDQMRYHNNTQWIEEIKPEEIPSAISLLCSIQGQLAVRLINEHKEPNEDSPKLLTAEQVGEILQVPKAFVYHMARKRELPFVCVGRKYKRFRPEDIKKLVGLNSQKELDMEIYKMYRSRNGRKGIKKDPKEAGPNPKTIGKENRNDPQHGSTVGARSGGDKGTDCQAN